MLNKIYLVRMSHLQQAYLELSALDGKDWFCCRSQILLEPHMMVHAACKVNKIKDFTLSCYEQQSHLAYIAVRHYR